MMDRLNVDENTPIETKMLTNQIESAQRKIESRNFGIRKNVLQYDDVLSSQREVIYRQRNQVLDGEDIHDEILKMIDQSIEEQGPSLPAGGDGARRLEPAGPQGLLPGLAACAGGSHVHEG